MSMCCCAINLTCKYLGLVALIDIESIQNRLLKVCYVPATTVSFQGFFFLLLPLTVLMKQTRHAVRAIKQSILLRCLGLCNSFSLCVFVNLPVHLSAYLEVLIINTYIWCLFSSVIHQNLCICLLIPGDKTVHMSYQSFYLFLVL